MESSKECILGLTGHISGGDAAGPLLGQVPPHHLTQSPTDETRLTTRISFGKSYKDRARTQLSYTGTMVRVPVQDIFTADLQVSTGIPSTHGKF
jgi:hypothetical protein